MVYLKTRVFHTVTVRVGKLQNIQVGASWRGVEEARDLRSAWEDSFDTVIRFVCLVLGCKTDEII
jgi:hypothetical protein